MMGAGVGMDALGNIAGSAGVGFEGTGLSKKEKSAVAHASNLGAVDDVISGVAV